MTDALRCKALFLYSIVYTVLVRSKSTDVSTDSEINKIYIILQQHQKKTNGNPHYNQNKKSFKGSSSNQPLPSATSANGATSRVSCGSTQLLIAKCRKCERIDNYPTSDDITIDIIINGVSHTLEIDIASKTVALSEDFYMNLQSSPPLKGSSIFGKDLIKIFKVDWTHIAVQCNQVQTAISSNLPKLLKDSANIFQPTTSANQIRDIKASIILKDEATSRFLKARSIPYALKSNVDKEL